VTRSTVLRAAGLLALVAGLVTASVLLPVKQYLAEFVEWVSGLGWWGPVIYALVYAVAGLVIPGSLITLGAGFAFGVVLGTVVVSAGSMMTAVIAFWLARTLFRGWVEARVAASPKFRAIDTAVAENGFKIVLLTRLSPVFPFTWLNYAFGLTRVRFGDYVIASWIGMLPGAVLYVYLGSTIHAIADLVSGNFERTPAQTALFWAGLAMAVVVTVLVTRAARNALRRAVPAAGSQEVSHDGGAAGAAR
jgi:uncharacterized membrane protein YdjX (TVP38/TMEM64 family)